MLATSERQEHWPSRPQSAFLPRGKLKPSLLTESLRLSSTNEGLGFIGFRVQGLGFRVQSPNPKP